MATYYVDNISGNSANDGLTTGTAKANITDLQAILTDYDIVKAKATGTDYIINSPVSSANLFTNTSKYLMTRYDTDTTNPQIRIVKTANTTWRLGGVSNSMLSVINVDFLIDLNNSTNTVFPFQVSQTAAQDAQLTNCTIDIRKYLGGTPTNGTTVHTFTPAGNASTEVGFTNCTIKGENYTYNTQFNGGTGRITLVKCQLQQLRSTITATVIHKCLIDVSAPGTDNPVINVTSGNPYFVKNNTIIHRYAATVSGIRIFQWTAGLQGVFADNLVINLDTTNSVSLYTPTGTMNVGEYYPGGNNIAYDCDQITSITGFKESMGSSVLITSNPLLSTTIGDPNYCVVDDANADAIAYIIGGSYFDSEDDVGAIAVASAGGGYPLLNVADVKIGVDRGDGSTGTYDGSDRWSDPSESNVKSGVAYKANSLTNNKTGNRTDADPTEVLTGSGTYGANGTEFTPSYSPDFPSASNVLTTDTTNGVTGTYVAPVASDVKSGVSFGNAETGTYDPITGSWEAVSASDLRSGVTKLQNGTSVNGLLDLPAESKVEIGTTYDNSTKTGTYTGANRWSDPLEANVRDGVAYKANSLTNNKLGTLDIDTEANLPAPSEVLVGSGNYGENLDIVPSYSPDFPLASNVRDTDTVNGVAGTLPNAKVAPSQGGTYLGEESNDLLSASNLKSGITVLNRGSSVVGTDKGESFNTALTASKLQSGYSVQNLGNTVVGTDKGEAFNDVLDASKLQIGYTVQNLGNTVVGTNTGGSSDYPLEKYVLKGITYASGAYEGTLGAINENGLDIVSQMIDSANIFIQNQLGTTWQPLKYFKEVEKNNFRANASQWGIRVLADSLTKEKLGKDTLDIEFEIKLTNDFQNRQGDDDERRSELVLVEKMEAIRRLLRETKFFKIDNVREVRTVERNEVERLGDNVLVVRSVITVNVDIKN